MFETAELGRTLSKAEYDEILPELRTALLKAQTELEGRDFPVIVLINGMEGAGKSETNNVLHEWFDARYLVTQAYEAPNEEERQHPEFWRYWQWLPRAGRIGIFLGSWYTRPILSRVRAGSSEAELLRDAQRINAFERALTDGGALIVKLWFHIGKKQQRARLARLASSKQTRYRVSKRDWKHHALYGEFRQASEQLVRETSTGNAPWTVIEAADDRYRDITTARQILAQLQQRLAHVAAPREPKPEPEVPDAITILDTLDLTNKLAKSEYEDRVATLQSRLNRLARKLLKQNKSALLVFEGPDAAGKGGAIRRVTWALDARQYRIIPIAAPNDEERAHHYLWRFWRHLPRRGRITIYDRSWYGRVLVERVEGFATPDEWMRAYQEINDFEKQLVDDGIVLLKFWLQISKDEQERRFQEREQEPWKQHKISLEDYRNRQKWNQYEAAANDMVARTSTEYAPWTLIEAEDKRFARVKVLETTCDRLGGKLR